ncbi:hypothetical protein TNCT_647981 [Trichonephila clavata]|uniref:Uncharacterized protein n=1 Tax=Trichonephila clavata TaxID=2740835 RepID=A0A8X6LZ18_TRICU|nr:hypothetical protein TNCT_647981 [Trichonephila clavata]
MRKKNLPYTEMDDEESMAINVEKCIKVVFLLLPLKLRFSSFSLLLFVMLLFPFRRSIESAFIIINVKSDPAAINHECREDTFLEGGMGGGKDPTVLSGPLLRTLSDTIMRNLLNFYRSFVKTSTPSPLCE